MSYAFGFGPFCCVKSCTIFVPMRGGLYAIIEVARVISFFFIFFSWKETTCPFIRLLENNAIV